MYIFIVNPNARTGLGIKIWHELEKTLKERKVSYQAYLTKYQRHATNLTRKILSEHLHPTLVVLGGDGTINEVVNGIDDLDAVTLAYLPIGSSNDFARGMKLSADPQKALDQILSPTQIAKLNIGTIVFGKEKRHFAVSAGIGFDAEVCYRMTFSKVKKFFNRISLGKLAYGAVALQSLFLQSLGDMTFTVDGTKTWHFHNVYFAAAMNQRYEGGGFLFCPKADPTDDMLDFIVVEKIPKLKVLFLLPLAYVGKHTKVKGIHIFHCKCAELESSVPLAVHTDGEADKPYTNASVYLEPKKLRMIIH